MNESLVNKPIELGISEPWEFGTSRKWEPIKGIIAKVKDEEPLETIIIKIDEPFTYKDIYCEYFVASTRFRGQYYDSLSAPVYERVHSNLTRISAEQYNSADPFDLSWWRGGGVTIIGQIELVGGFIWDGLLERLRGLNRKK